MSLYTAKARSYLRKQGIDFVEVSPGRPRYTEVVMAATGRWIIPVLETPTGELIQDSAAIIDWFEAGGGPTRYPALPEAPVHLAVSRLFELFGGEGLLRPAMHYRWNFDRDNLAFLESEFWSGMYPDSPPEEAAQLFAWSSGRMRRAATNFGITAESVPLIEAAFIDWLDRLSAHLAAAPYLLGGRPTLGDYALMGPMWAHLFRDPVPSALIKRHAPRVGRWVERMSTSEPYEVEYAPRPHGGPDLFPDGGIPPTLEALMAFVAEEFLPEMAAHVDFANEWLAARPDLETGTNGLPRPGSRAIGETSFAWRGITVTSTVMPYRFWLLQRLQAAASGPGAGAVRKLFAGTGLEPLLDMRTSRPVERRGHLEVWGDPL